ncbi:MAG: amidohydrolase family protein [Gaiellales bacterium]
MAGDRYQDTLAHYERRSRELLPPGTRIWDAHTHLGVDEDGFALAPDTQVTEMRLHEVDRAFTFPLNDPDRFPAYRVPNDRVLSWAADAGDMLIPFCRLDMADSPIEEATRCLDRGARGIKLHPRAQGFGFDEKGLDPVFRIAAERRVPILIHAGRGRPPIAEALRHLVERHPEAQLILAHAAIADLEHIARTLTAHPNVNYDTSVWSPIDIRALLASASPEQIMYASDVPYGTYPVGQFQLALALRATGATDDQIRGVFWDNAERVSQGRAAERLSPPLQARELAQPLQHLRIREYLNMAATLLWLRQPDGPGVMGLARCACDVSSGNGLAEVAGLLELAEELWDDEQRAAFRLIQIAAALLLDSP